MIEKKDALQVCREILEVLREGTILYEFFIGLLRKYVKDCGLTLEEIGTSESDLKDLSTRCSIVAAKYILKSLRSSDVIYNFEIDRVRKEVKNGNLTLDQIGTTEEELEALRVKGCKQRAMRSFEYLKSDASLRFINADSFVEEVTNGNLTLADIGITAKELAALAVHRDK